MITYTLIVRHGENEWVSKNLLAGRTPGVLLNAKGRSQSERLADRIPLDNDQPATIENCIHQLYATTLQRMPKDMMKPRATSQA